MQIRKRPSVVFVTMLLLAFALSGCATLDIGGPKASIVAKPDQVVLSPALIKEPVVITGSGWKPGEMVVVNLHLPPGVSVKGAEPGAPVGIAEGTAKDTGILETNVGAMAILMTFLQVGWDNNAAKPDFKEAKPLPPGTYTLEAIGTESDRKAETKLTLLPPPKKQ